MLTFKQMGYHACEKKCDVVLRSDHLGLRVYIGGGMRTNYHDKTPAATDIRHRAEAARQEDHEVLNNVYIPRGKFKIDQGNFLMQQSDAQKAARQAKIRNHFGDGYYRTETELQRLFPLEQPEQERFVQENYLSPQTRSRYLEISVKL